MYVVQGMKYDRFGRAVFVCLFGFFFIRKKRRMTADDENLVPCDNCGWRFVHYRCLGLKGKPDSPWFCFKCEDTKARGAQKSSLPVFDNRVHEEYWQTVFPRKRAAGGADEKDLEEELLGSGGMLPILGRTAKLDGSSSSSSVQAPEALVRCVKRILCDDGDADLDAASKCANCQHASRPGLNYCEMCGKPLRNSRRVMDQMVSTASDPAGGKSRTRHIHISYKGLLSPDAGRYEDGTVRLCEVESLHGHTWALHLMNDGKLSWMKEK